MNTFRLKATLVSGVVALTLAACGGSGGSGGSDGDGGGTGVPANEVKLSGTAATGLALVGSTVDVKCASGTGTAVTGADGGYTVTVTDGALPCVIRVTGTADGVSVTLHSIAEAGTASGATTTATANVTPLTEMVMAQLAQGMPTSFFDSFGAGSTVTSEQLSAATTTLLTALASATGIDLDAIDPFKATLVPATSTTAGNAYDDALEALKAKISLDALPLVVNQIASASAASSDSVSTPITLTDVLEGASAGTLQNCPSALSGKYRVLDFRGATQVVQLDFGRNKAIDGTTELDIAPSTTQNCEFTVNDGNGTTVVFGPSGVGALRDDNAAGFIFPVQSLAYSAIQGEWHFVESGVTDTGAPENFVGKINFAADRAVSMCDYAVAGGIATCTPDSGAPQAPQERSDGGFTMTSGWGDAVFYGYRTPAGRLTLFGTGNPDGVDAPGTHQTHFVAFKPAPVVLPEVNTVRKTWDLLMMKTPTGPLTSSPLDRVTQTITAVDSTNGTYSRVRDVQPDVTDVFSINKPLSGMVERTVRPIYAAALPGLGMTLAINAPGNPNFLYSMTVTRP